MNDDERSSFDECGCCAGLAAPAPLHNDPGLPALAYRIGTQPGFQARLLQGVAHAPARPGVADSARPLARLLTRSPDDPAVGLLDAAACVADVLSFYQERIANEGFMRTATERRSVLELARAIGYELKPGVTASVHLAFTVEDAPGAPGVCTLAQGTPVQSVPPQDRLPQVFETGMDFTARAEWNALRPRRTRPADLALLAPGPAGGAAAGAAGAATRPVLVLLGPRGSFPPDAPGLHPGLLSAGLARLDPGLPIDAEVDALEVSRLYFTEAATGLAGGDLLLFVARPAIGPVKRVLRVVDAVAEPALRRVRVDLEPLPHAALPLPSLPSRREVLFRRQDTLTLAHPHAASKALTTETVAQTVTRRVWSERDLQAQIGLHGWSSPEVVQAAAAPPPAPPPDAGAFAFGARLAFFGHNAPRWATLPTTGIRQPDVYKNGWDAGDTGAGATPRTVWTDSQGTPNGPLVFLERAVPNVTRGGWVVFDAPEHDEQAFGVADAREVSRADFGISGRALALTLAGDDGQRLSPVPASRFFFRDSAAYVASRRLGLAELPIETDIEAGSDRIELDRMVLGLSPGQPVALSGRRADLAGVDGAEIVVLRDIVHAEGRTTLQLDKGPVQSYRRDSLVIQANVVPATHGETVREVLGHGDASIPHQQFTLKQPPVTHLSAPTPRGARSTLEVRVNGVRWDEVPSLFGAAPDQPAYVARIDDDARMQLTFGDGVQGARLPTGTLNVAARYRSGIGPHGEVDAGTLTQLRAMPLGLRGVTNPVAASGAEGPERLADARRNAPLALLAFERVVSLRDYEHLARVFPGIGKARADVLWIDGASQVFLTLAGATGGQPGTDVLDNLRRAIASASDRGQRFDVDAFVPRYFRCRARVAVEPRREAGEVRAAAAAALRTGFGFEARALGQSVTAAEVMALLHTVPGVLAVDLEELYALGDPRPSSAEAAADPAQAAVPAFGARWHAPKRRVLAAELLLLEPTGATVEELAP
jgi:predicted phage baseplate assembly protein